MSLLPTPQRTPAEIRAEVAASPERREMLQDATRELLAATQAFIERYVALPDAVGGVLALWCLHTWTLQACDTTPYLLVLSQEPGSGKSRLLETLSYLVRKPWSTAATTHTALFRRMSEDQPTLLLDELDTVFRGGTGNEALRAVLNAGNRRGSTVTRCDGKWGTREYATYGAKAMAGIDTGFLPDTVVDRSIVIRMSKTRQATQRLRPHVAAAESAPLANTLEQWSLIVLDELAKIQLELPAELSDRACDAWEPLMQIGELAGGEWPSRARLAAQALSGAPDGTIDAPAGEELLPGLANVIGARAPLTMDDAEEFVYQRKQEKKAKRAEVESRHGFASRANCGVCGRYKPAPADICPHCGDAPLQHNGDAHEFNRAYGMAA